MKAEAAQLSDEDLKQAVEEISNFHKSGIFRCPTVDKAINLWHERSKIPFKNTREFVSGAEKIILLEAAQRWIDSQPKPIETVPKDRKVLLLNHGGWGVGIWNEKPETRTCKPGFHGYVCGWAAWSGNYEDDVMIENPSHWKPLD